ncbi:hypothetical protein BGC33_03540 [Bathymodiolus thermophilus thioautotrophic gill symbiont]|uniref:Uncharacterized protein n=2 Tax=Bathymodiolus thermophilus thioautotrophic gill symbiont TaxID=2360 RepID=A0A1J5U7S1_9GAMM|nr:hypothetical protein BGC33_03540 [Bathymodiolus thermophilus thioautotrophic gill symbiont]
MVEVVLLAEQMLTLIMMVLVVPKDLLEVALVDQGVFNYVKVILIIVEIKKMNENELKERHFLLLKKIFLFGFLPMMSSSLILYSWLGLFIGKIIAIIGMIIFLYFFIKIFVNFFKYKGWLRR